MSNYGHKWRDVGGSVVCDYCQGVRFGLSDSSVCPQNNRDERMVRFFIEFSQGIEVGWLIDKYGFNGVLEPDGMSCKSKNSEGEELLKDIKNLSPFIIAKARLDQKSRLNEYPWINPPSKYPYGRRINYGEENTST